MLFRSAMCTLMNLETDSRTGLAGSWRARARAWLRTRVPALAGLGPGLAMAALAAPSPALAAPSNPLPALDGPSIEAPAASLDSPVASVQPPTLESSVTALADWGHRHASFATAVLSATPSLSFPGSAALHGRSEAEGRRLLGDVLTMAALAESSDWGGVDPICALRESAVGASQSFRESLALGAIELAQLAPTDGQIGRASCRERV